MGASAIVPSDRRAEAQDAVDLKDRRSSRAEDQEAADHDVSTHRAGAKDEVDVRVRENDAVGQH